MNEYGIKSALYELCSKLLVPSCSPIYYPLYNQPSLRSLEYSSDSDYYIPLAELFFAFAFYHPSFRVQGLGFRDALNP